MSADGYRMAPDTTATFSCHFSTGLIIHHGTKAGPRTARAQNTTMHAVPRADPDR